MYSDGVGHGCSSTLELPIISSPSSQRNRNEVPIIFSSGSEREKKENEGARRKKGAVVSMKRETDNQVVDKNEMEKEKEEEKEMEDVDEKEKEEAEEKEKEKEREDRVSELQSLTSAACHGPGSSLYTVMATKLKSDEQLADRASADVTLRSSRASDESSNYHLPLATKIKYAWTILP